MGSYMATLGLVPSCVANAAAKTAAREFTRGHAGIQGRARVVDLSGDVAPARDFAKGRPAWPSSTCGCLRFFVLGSDFSGAQSLMHSVKRHPSVFTFPNTTLDNGAVPWTNYDPQNGARAHESCMCAAARGRLCLDRWPCSCWCVLAC